MKFSHQKFLIASLLLFTVFSLTYYALFQCQLGNYVKAEWWLADLHNYRDHLVSQKKSPKIIIAGGSSSLFGINSQVLKKNTGFEVINLASHLSLDLDFYYYKIKEHMREGDIVLLPLEYEYYSTSNDIEMTDWFVNNITAWGKKDYLDKLPLIDLVNFIFHVPKKRIYQGILNRNKEVPVHDKSFIMNTLSNSDVREWHGYSYKSVNRYGEIGIDAEPLQALSLLKQVIGYDYINTLSLSEHFLEVYSKINNLVQNRNGTLLLTWPPSMKNKKFNLNRKEHAKKLNKFSGLLARESIRISCPPEKFNLDIQNFFNTHYHLNRKGAIIRTERLATCLNTILTTDP